MTRALRPLIAAMFLCEMPVHADDKAAVEAIMAPFVKDKPYLGVVVGVSRESGRAVWGFGEVELAGKKMTPDASTLFEIGSVTKAFTGTLLAERVLAGGVKLDDPAQKYLPSPVVMPRRDERDITLLHLSTHTSSLPVQPPFLGLFTLKTKNPSDPYAEYDLQALGKSLANTTLPRPIGSQFEYSNLGAGILGHALAHSANAKDYESLLVERLLNPLAMRDTRVRLSPEQNLRLAPGYKSDGSPASAWTFASLEACGGLRSTAQDLLIFLDAALARKPHNLESAFQFARQPWRETTRRGEVMGLGWILQKNSAGDTLIVWHNGGTGGYRSYIAFAPDARVGVVVLANAKHSVDAVGMAILRQLTQEKKE